MKPLVEELKKINVDIDKRIMSATQNVNIDCILGWQKKGKKYSYLDFYDDE
jgi:hypothetical protein